MAQSTQVVQTKMLDYFFSLRKLHTIAFQPIVTLVDRRAVRVRVPVPPAHADAAAVDRSVVQAAINTDRGVELDVYIVAPCSSVSAGSRRPRATPVCRPAATRST